MILTSRLSMEMIDLTSDYKPTFLGLEQSINVIHLGLTIQAFDISIPTKEYLELNYPFLSFINDNVLCCHLYMIKLYFVISLFLISFQILKLVLLFLIIEVT